MSDYTPTTEAIRGRIIQRGIGWGFYGLDEFDRWLATHDAEKRAEWEAEQGDYHEGFEEGIKVGRAGSGPRPITDEMVAAADFAIMPYWGERYPSGSLTTEIARAALEAAEGARR